MLPGPGGCQPVRRFACQSARRQVADNAVPTPARGFRIRGSSGRLQRGITAGQGVGRLGFEPRTYGLKVRCSAVELTAPNACDSDCCGVEHPCRSDRLPAMTRRAMTASTGPRRDARRSYHRQMTDSRLEMHACPRANRSDSSGCAPAAARLTAGMLELRGIAGTPGEACAIDRA